MYVGETATAIVAAVVRAEPDGSMLPKNLPRRVRELLQSRTHLGRAGRIPLFALRWRHPRSNLKLLNVHLLRRPLGLIVANMWQEPLRRLAVLSEDDPEGVIVLANQPRI
jgi:hypothetical protein